MNLEQLNFHHLHYFWRVAKTGNLTRAAEDLHVSQSALSAQIRQLEQRLGEALFSRAGRRLRLTDTGQLVLSYADTIFGLGREMLGRLQGRSDGVTRLRVGSVATMSRNYQENWIRPLLDDPLVVLTLESGLLEGLPLAKAAALGQAAASIKLSSRDSVSAQLSRDRLKDIAGF